MAQRTWTFLALIVGLLASTISVAAQKIGIASAVLNTVHSVANGARALLRVGDGLVQNQSVETEETATAQLLFADETTMTVGPRSRVVLDRFVYNPATGTGDIVLRATKGAFRFISGAARPDTYKIKTPTATIGVRGTIIDGYCDPGGNCLFIVQEGEVVFFLRDGKTIEAVAGTYVYITAAGMVTTGSYEGSIFSIPATGVSFPLFGWRFRFDEFEEFNTFNAGDFNDALDSIVMPAPAEPPEDEDCGSSC